jgi:hypothetical protein
MINEAPPLLHPVAAFWLDVSDKMIKLLAVLVAGAWTWMHYSRGRTYAKKLELQISGSVFLKRNLYLEISTGLKNLGASKYTVQRHGSVCEIVAIMADLSEIPVDIFSPFERHDRIEPGESIGDSRQCLVNLRPEDIVWIQVNLRVISEKTEWNSSYLVKVA